MHVKRKTKIQIIGIIVIVIGIMIGIIPIFLKNNKLKKEKNKVENYINYTSIKEKDIKEEEKKEEVIENPEENKTVENNSNEEDYLLVLEIPKIDFQRGVYPLNSELNTIEKNVQIMKESSLPYVEKGNLVLEAHNGTADIAYFRNLYKLQNGDVAYIYFEGTKYTYVVSDVYDVSKDGDVEIYRDNDKTTLSLITCKKNTKDRQLVVILYLKDKEQY